MFIYHAKTLLYLQTLSMLLTFVSILLTFHEFVYAIQCGYATDKLLMEEVAVRNRS